MPPLGLALRPLAVWIRMALREKRARHRSLPSGNLADGPDESGQLAGDCYHCGPGVLALVDQMSVPLVESPVGLAHDLEHFQRKAGAPIL